MDWWNRLTPAERAFWLNKVGEGASAAEAWEAYKNEQPAKPAG